MSLDLSLIIEVISVVFSLAYLFLLMRENIWCWLFGILSSALSIYLFIEAKLYSESILYFFYVLVGIYGWWVWGKAKDKPLLIKQWPILKSVMAFLAGGIGALGLGWFFTTYTDAEKPYIDATTTSFSFIASFLEAHKVLSAWIYWILINGVSIWLYTSRELYIYGGLMVFYFGMSIYGFYAWRKRMLVDE